MLVCYWQKIMQLVCGTVLSLMLACGESHQPYMMPQGTKIIAKDLGKMGLDVGYRIASMTTIIEIVDAAGISVTELARLSGMQVRPLTSHLRGKRQLSNASLAKLQAGLHQVVDSVEIKARSKLYHHQMIDALPQVLKVERAAVRWQQDEVSKILPDDDLYATYAEDIVAIRNEGIATAVAYIKTTTPKPKGHEIAALLQKYAVTADDFDNHKFSSIVVLRKIINTIGETYGAKFFADNSLQLSPYVLGKTTMTDKTVAKIKSIVEQNINKNKVAQQHSAEEVVRQIEVVFGELDLAIRVERAARLLHRRLPLLDSIWKERVEQVLEKRKRANTIPLRHSTNLEQINTYNKSSRAIFLEIADALLAGGWLLPFNEGTEHVMFNDFMNGKSLLGDASWQKLEDVIKKTIADKPVNTGITKQATIEKLKVLLPKLKAALRVENALHEMQKDIDNLSKTLQQLVQQAVAIRDEHLMLTRFRVTWDDVKSFNASSVTVIRELLAILNLNSRKISMHTSLNNGAVSSHLKGVFSLRDTSLAELISFLCATIASAKLSTEKTTELQGKAIQLLKLTRIEKAANKLLKDDKKVALLSLEEEEQLHRVAALKKKALGGV